jgi:SAM-dependent methyltransferase
MVDGGLEPREITLFEKIPLSKGRVLVLGLGGGREAIHFARLGFEVTGIDFIPEMAENSLRILKRKRPMLTS